MVPWTGRGPGHAPGPENPSPSSSSRDGREFHPTPEATRRCPAFNGSDGTMSVVVPTRPAWEDFPSRDGQRPAGAGRQPPALCCPAPEPSPRLVRTMAAPAALRPCVSPNAGSQTEHLCTCPHPLGPRREKSRASAAWGRGTGGRCAAPCGTEGRTLGAS